MLAAERLGKLFVAVSFEQYLWVVLCGTKSVRQRKKKPPVLVKLPLAPKLVVVAVVVDKGRLLGLGQQVVAERRGSDWRL